MTSKMQALLAGGLMLAATVAGVAVYVSVPASGTTQADLVDAGIVTDYVPHRLACLLYFDGGYHEIRPIVAVAKTLEPDGRRATIWPPAARQLRPLIADMDQNCRDVGALTWAAVQAEYSGASVTEGVGDCACWQPDAGDCRQSDGGVQVRDGHNEFAPGDFVGAGCVPKPCGEVAGLKNWPAGCAP